MTHMVCWYPSYKESEEIFQTLVPYSEYIEIQFPFSDPIADGPLIEEANLKALGQGMTTQKCFEFIQKIAYTDVQSLQDKNRTKLLIMTYYNIVLHYWVEKFIQRAKKLGVYGFIIPDIPYDEEDGRIFRDLCKKYGIVCTEIISPATSSQRLEEIAQRDPELVYALSQNMTTGSNAEFWEWFQEYIKNLRNYFNGSIWVWFWVKTRKHVEKVCEIADFAIIGSEFIKQHKAWGIWALKEYLQHITWE